MQYVRRRTYRRHESNIALCVMVTNPHRNGLLARLPQEDVDALSRELTLVKMSLKQVLYDPGTQIDHVYFPTSGLVSLVTPVDDGSAIETGAVGREGMAGLSAFLGMSRAADMALCQIPGEALRMRTETLLRETARNEKLRTLLLRYTNALMAMAAQSAACNRAHGVRARLSRWLLTIHDRADADTFPITQEFLVQMLGVRRPTVSVASAGLQRAGLIRYSRGKMIILNRAKLETACCGCYARIKTQFLQALEISEGQI